MSQTMLLVEEDKDHRTTCRVILAYHAYRVLVAGDGGRASP